MNEETALVAEGPSAARLVLLGAPGSGKGTQASRLAARVGIAHVGTGDLMRARAEVGDEVGTAARPYLERGDLAPDSLVTAALAPALAAVAAHGFVLDGFPRNVAQAAGLTALLERLHAPLDAAIHLGVPDTVLRRRLAIRAETSGRSDDTAEVRHRRLDLGQRRLQPVLAYYHDAGILVRVDGDRPVGAVTKDILAALTAGTGPHSPFK